MGSKSTIVDFIASVLPPATHFYDLFAGGCAVTHKIMLLNRYQYIHCNDITDAPLLFKNAIEGKYRDERQWISREDFFMFKDSDPYIRICWSFGNNQKGYMYSREIEPYKRAVHQLLFAETINERKLAYRRVIGSLSDMGILLAYGDESKGQAYLPEKLIEILKKQRPESLQNLQSLERLQRLQSLESLQNLQRLKRLKRLKSLKRLQITRCDYHDVDILPDSVIYCDIPYKGTEGYLNSFDYDRFYEWCARQKEKVFISEYEMPEDRFVCIAERKRTDRFSNAKKLKINIERIFIPIHQKQ